MPLSNDKIGNQVHSSSGHDANPVVDGGIARTSFASGMQGAAFAISIVASLSLLGWVLLRCRSGFDLPMKVST